MSDEFAELDALASQAYEVTPLAPTIGASEVACILGFHPYLSPYKLWAQLCGLIPRREAGNLATRRGQILEPALRDWYARESSMPIHPGPGIDELPWTRPDAPWQAARPDGWTSERLVEIKTASGWEDWGPEGTDQIPTHYAAQVLWQQWVAASHLENLQGTDLVAYDRWTDEIRVYRLPLRLDLAEKLVRKVASWWRLHVELGTPPSLDGTEATRSALNSRWPVERSPELEPTPELEQLVTDYRLTVDLAATAEAHKEVARNRLVAAIGGAAGITGLCTYRASKGRLQTDLKALERDHPGLLAQYQTLSPPTRTLRLKKEPQNG